MEMISLDVSAGSYALSALPDPTPRMEPTHMTQAGVYGPRLGRRLQSDNAPALITRSLRSAELAVTETRNDDPEPSLSGSLPSEEAYLVSLKFRDYPDCECWERGRCVIKTDIRSGATYLYDLKRDPRRLCEDAMLHMTQSAGRD